MGISDKHESWEACTLKSLLDVLGQRWGDARALLHSASPQLWSMWWCARIILTMVRYKQGETGGAPPSRGNPRGVKVPLRLTTSWGQGPSDRALGRGADEHGTSHQHYRAQKTESRGLDSQGMASLLSGVQLAYLRKDTHGDNLACSSELVWKSHCRVGWSWIWQWEVTPSFRVSPLFLPCCSHQGEHRVLPPQCLWASLGTCLWWGPHTPANSLGPLVSAFGSCSPSLTTSLLLSGHGIPPTLTSWTSSSFPNTSNSVAKLGSRLSSGLSILVTEHLWHQSSIFCSIFHTASFKLLTPSGVVIDLLSFFCHQICSLPWLWDLRAQIFPAQPALALSCCLVSEPSQKCWKSIWTLGKRAELSGNDRWYSHPLTLDQKLLPLSYLEVSSVERREWKRLFSLCLSASFWHHPVMSGAISGEYINWSYLLC